MADSFLAVSAPGKVLICGGYLIVDRPNIGLSLALSSRFHTVAVHHRGSCGHAEEEVDLHIHVRSHQFQRTFPFRLRVSNGERRKVKLAEGEGNSFIRAALTYAVAVAVAQVADWEEVKKKYAVYTSESPLRLHLFADNAFYSQQNYLGSIGKEVTYEALEATPRFNPIVGEVGKTGLGSSACLTTSLVAAILESLMTTKLSCDSTEARSRAIIHAVAQLAHSHAQGKIGSGFDVCSAVFGSGIYTRFTPDRVNAIIQEHPVSDAIDVATLSKSLGVSPDVAAEGWDHEMTPSGLPDGLCLILGDVNKGSETPGMVSGIFKWKKETEGADVLWDHVKACNERAVASLALLRRLCAEQEEEYGKVVAALEQLPSGSWESWRDGGEVLQAFLEARDAFHEARVGLREVGRRAGVAVEPDQQTNLVDATLRHPGVLAAGCPGAGGYDAVFAICLSQRVRRALTTFWMEYEDPAHNVTKKSVCGLLVDEDKQGGVRCTRYQDMASLLAAYPELA